MFRAALHAWFGSVSRTSSFLPEDLIGHRTFHPLRASVHPKSGLRLGGRQHDLDRQSLVALVAALHVYFLVLEMFLWTKPLGLKTFRNSPEKATDSAVLAANQGLYNGFLAAGLVWGLIQGVPAFAFQIKMFFLLCVIVAGVYGAAPSAAGFSSCRPRPPRSR